MRDIKVSQVGTTWQLVNPSKGEIFLQGMEGALSYFITSTLLAPANNEAGLPLEVLAYRTASGHVWVKAVGTGRILSGLFESPGERVFFEGAYATLQQSFLFTQQTALPELVTALASVTEGDTTHPVAASVIFEMLTALSQEFQNISTALGDKAPLDSPSLTGDALAPTREPGDNSTHIATTAYADDAASTAQTNAEGYADGLVVGLWDDRGTYDPTPGTWPTSADNGSGVGGAILKGDIWSISTAGTLTGGVSVNIGDVIRALVDGAGNTATDWGVTENNLGYAAENSANKATDLTSPDNTKYPTTQAVVTGLGTREPTLPAAVGATKFLREDRTFQELPTPAPSRDVGGGGGNTLGTNCLLLNCTNVALNGNDNVAINCRNITTNAAQKDLILENCINVSASSLPRFPKGSRVSMTRGSAGYRDVTVTTEFSGVKAANVNHTFSDGDGIKLPVTAGLSTHSLTLSYDEFNGIFAKRRILVSGGVATVQTEGIDLQSGGNTTTLLVTAAVASGMLDITVALNALYNSNQLFIRCKVDSVYASLV